MLIIRQSFLASLCTNTVITSRQPRSNQHITVIVNINHDWWWWWFWLRHFLLLFAFFLLYWFAVYTRSSEQNWIIKMSSVKNSVYMYLLCMYSTPWQIIGHFQVGFNLCLKTSSGAQPFVWKLVLPAHLLSCKTHFHMKGRAPGLTLRLCNRGKRQLRNGLLYFCIN